MIIFSILLLNFIVPQCRQYFCAQEVLILLFLFKWHIKCLLKCFIGIWFFQTCYGYVFNDQGVWVLVSLVLKYDFFFFFWLAEGNALPDTFGPLDNLTKLNLDQNLSCNPTSGGCQGRGWSYQSFQGQCGEFLVFGFRFFLFFLFL